MQAIRTIKTIKNGSFTIDLPADFTAKKVEVIVLPLKGGKNGNSKSIRETLLNGPHLTDKDMEEYNSMKKWLETWQPEQF
ncbi:MAG: hypothetical protein PHW04_15480 [Candidatus Wallbacteria bacterium]|nr:hypothetical protein [Candidatus Wallbacteria bacterium]